MFCRFYIYSASHEYFCEIREIINSWLNTSKYLRIHDMPTSKWKTIHNFGMDQFEQQHNLDKKNKNIERQTAGTIVSWPNHKQWVKVHTSDLMMMMIRQSIYIISIITREMGKLKTYNPTYCIMDSGENTLNLTHTLDKFIWLAFYKFNAFR